MTKPARIVAVTGGLVVAGAVLGATAGAVALTASLLITENAASAAIGALFGGPLGALTAPPLAWLLLRRVPLGRMFAGSATGAAVGGVVGWITTTSEGNLVGNGLAGAFVGCVVACLLLRYRAAPAR